MSDDQAGLRLLWLLRDKGPIDWTDEDALFLELNETRPAVIYSAFSALLEEAIRAEHVEHRAGAIGVREARLSGAGLAFLRSNAQTSAR